MTCIIPFQYNYLINPYVLVPLCDFNIRLLFTFEVLFPQEKCNFGRHFSFAKEVPLTGCMTDVSATSCMGRSPFPAVDKFVESVASTGSVSGNLNRV